ncbi:hypothetical protein DQ04_00601170 [Trypanosoma grayi]|uniref:hypothetical protein n=1 Tax=Trypanosoma grayi TaxID=71804 RepID=UPI0004F48FD4|nr:hypothetical protein DQ04_00601170 [Trypanosoma grayi]KEG14150.1 hypothetical protein DQ04_00601170 [Trypanosoma grayi]
MYASRAKSTRFKAVVERTRRLLLNSAAGPNGIRALSRSLGIAVDSGGALLGREKFVEALNSTGVHLDDGDVEAVMYALDRNGDGTLDPVDFIAALRRDLTPLKRTWIIRVWYLFSENRDGAVQIDELLGVFNASGHPAVVCGERTEAEVREEFQATFNTTTNPEGVITRQEFEQYYSCVAGTCPDDASFVTLMQGVWPVAADAPDERPVQLAMEQNSANTTFKATLTAAEKSDVNKRRQHVADMDKLIRDVHRPAVMSDPLAVRQLSLSLREVDTDGAFFLSRDTFLAALWKQRLYVTNPQDLLAVLDTKGDGSVDYLLYMMMLLPPLPSARLMMLERLWDLFPKDTSGGIDVLELHKRFQAKDGEEKNAFLGAWDVRRAIQRRVTMEELIEWYTPASLATQLDNEFDTLLKRQWGLV